MANIDRKKYRSLVYICSVFSGDEEGNAKKAREYSRFAVDRGVVPLAPHLLLPQFMDGAEERELAMSMDLVFLGKCEEIWVFGSERMEAEIGRAERRNMKNRYFTEGLKEDTGCR